MIRLTLPKRKETKKYVSYGINLRKQGGPIVTVYLPKEMLKGWDVAELLSGFTWDGEQG